MFYKLPVLPPRVSRLLVITIFLFALFVFVACSDSSDSGKNDANEDADRLALVWESWEHINKRYASSDPLDHDSIVSGAMNSLMSKIDVEAYPFLTEIGRIRGQAPAHIPGELVDLWRAVTKYNVANPDFDPSTVAESIVAGLMYGLGDPSAVYLDAEQYPLAKESLSEGVEGSYLGIGSRVVKQDGKVVLFPFAGSPSEKAGILPGDVLTAVAGNPVVDQSVQDVVDQVGGPKGTKIVLDVVRAGESVPLAVEVYRGDVELQSVASQLIPGGVGYIRISRFRHNTGEQVFSALEAWNQLDLLALVMDLRTNPGGSLDAAVETAGHFLPSGSTFGFEEGKDGRRTEIVIGSNDNRLDMDSLLVAVLVNGQTARESEMLASALQETHRATLFGVATRGDVSGYEFMELSDGSAIYLPVSRRYSHSGKLLMRTGLEPDVTVESVPENEGYGRESQFNRAYEFLDGQLPPFR